MQKCVQFFALLLILCGTLRAQTNPTYKVLGFFTGKNDLAHISFVHEANKWFYEQSRKDSFTYDSTSNWDDLNEKVLSHYQIVLFLDTRPEKPEQRAAFEKYMRNGGAWIGFHFAAFALTPSAYNQNWSWYHEEFLGSGQFVSNTWRPTSAVLRVEDRNHAVTEGLPATFSSCPNEWYQWEHDLRKNPDINILLSIDPSSFPLGTGPKSREIWHSGYYPVVWTNTRYKMIYINMGHNDMDYEKGTNKRLSSTFCSDEQNTLLMAALSWLGRGK